MTCASIAYLCQDGKTISHLICRMSMRWVTMRPFWDAEQVGAWSIPKGASVVITGAIARGLRHFDAVLRLRITTSVNLIREWVLHHFRTCCHHSRFHIDIHLHHVSHKAILYAQCGETPKSAFTRSKALIAGLVHSDSFVTTNRKTQYAASQPSASTVYHDVGTTV